MPNTCGTHLVRSRHSPHIFLSVYATSFPTLRTTVRARHPLLLHLRNRPTVHTSIHPSIIPSLPFLALSYGTRNPTHITWNPPPHRVKTATSARPLQTSMSVLPRRNGSFTASVFDIPMPTHQPQPLAPSPPLSHLLGAPSSVQIAHVPEMPNMHCHICHASPVAPSSNRRHPHVCTASPPPFERTAAHYNPASEPRMRSALWNGLYGRPVFRNVVS